MALWAAGPGFVCHGEALDENYDGDMLRPSDMKQIITRFYNTKRLRNQKISGSGGLDLTHEHIDEDIVGDVHDMYINKAMGLMNIIRISPVTKSGKDIIQRVKKSSDPKGKQVGLSYDYAWLEVGKGKDTRTANKYVKRLSIVEEPAHHKDGTYIIEWADSEEELLRKLFNGTYGPDADEKGSEPYYITNTLKKRVVALFDTEEVDAVDEKKNTTETKKDDKKPIAEGKTNDDKKTEKQTIDTKKESGNASKAKMAQANEAKEETGDQMDIDTNQETEKPKASVTPTPAPTPRLEKEANNIAGSNEDDAMEIDQVDNSQVAKDSTQKPTKEDAKKEAPKKQDTSMPLFDDKAVKHDLASKETPSSFPSAAGKDSKKPAGTNTAVAAKESGPKMAANMNEGAVDTANTGNNNDDAMDIDENPPPPTQSVNKGKQTPPPVNERKTDTGAVKRSLPPAGNQSAGTEKNEGDEAGEAVEEGEKAVPEPAGKKQKLSENTSKPTSSYGLTPHDANIQLTALNSSVQDLLKWANLKNATQEEQAAFFQNMIDTHTKQLMENQKSTELTIRNLLSNAGLKEAEINTFVEAAEQNEQVGQAVRTMAAAAHAGGMNHRLANIKYQENKNDASLLDIAQNVMGRQSFGKSSGASIFNSDGSMKRQTSNLDFTASIFGFQSQQPQAQAQQTPRRVTGNNTNQSQVQRPNLDNNRSLGGTSTPTISPEEQARRDEEKMQEEFRKKLEVSGPRIVRTIPFDVNNPIFSIRDEYGQSAIDTFDLRPELIQNIPLGGYTHQFMSALKMHGVRSGASKDIEYTTYGDDKANEKYYATLGPQTAAYRAPRRIQGGLVTIGEENPKLDF